MNSLRATQFRQWATGILRDFSIRGYVLDKERLKNGAFFSKDYFDNLLEEIREIRASERRFYQKITDIYATAMDYLADAEATQTFFATVQNKLHFAIHGHTAAELIMQRASGEKEHMGLTTWKKAPNGKILKPDVAVAKNYLTEKELKALDRIDDKRVLLWLSVLCPYIDENSISLGASDAHLQDRIPYSILDKSSLPLPPDCLCTIYKKETKKSSHFAAFPSALVETPIKAGCPPDGIVLDPFTGTGKTLTTAISLGMNYIGFELSEEYIPIIEKNINIAEKKQLQTDFLDFLFSNKDAMTEYLSENE